uniref:Uncharacterized protein n=1 Tax=Trieres chinensis TaxID=1514140 RepID=A0A7S1ZAC9_TRICV
MNRYSNAQNLIANSGSRQISSPALAMARTVMIEEVGQNVAHVLSTISDYLSMTCTTSQMSTGKGPADNTSVLAGLLSGQQSYPNFQGNAIHKQFKSLGHNCESFKRPFEEAAAMDRKVKARTSAQQNMNG